MGARSPNPKVQDETNLALLRLYKVENQSIEAVSRVIGPPTDIFQNLTYPEIYYCKHPKHWTVMCPNCVTILPRNPQYDSIMQLSMDQWMCEQVDRITAEIPQQAR